MIITNAIRILAAKKRDDEARKAEASAEACQLGIEALKEVKHFRFSHPPLDGELLPGETQEEQT